MKVPFLELRRINSFYEQEFEEAYKRIVGRGWYLLGEELTAFENAFAEYCQAKFCVGVANGLDALTLILHSLDIKRGDEVIVPAHTFIATWLAVARVGAVPVPVDVEYDSCNINSSEISRKITNKTKAIIAVHLYGRSADMSSLREIAKANALFLIEDAAQAHGALYNGLNVGTLSDAAAFSFYPGKNLGALGDGGAVATNDAAIASKIRKLRNYGSEQKYIHELMGINSRLSEFQAAFLGVKLKSLDRIVEIRNRLATLYTSGMGGLPLTLPEIPQSAEQRHSCHLYVVRIETSSRAGLIESLNEKGIQTQIHYPIPCHLSKAFRDLGFSAGSFPVTERIAGEVISLPMNECMTDAEVSYIIESIRNYFSG